MNPHIIIERKPSDWITTTIVVVIECIGFMAIGYFGRPVIQSWIGG